MRLFIDALLGGDAVRVSPGGAPRGEQWQSRRRSMLSPPPPPPPMTASEDVGGEVGGTIVAAPPRSRPSPPPLKRRRVPRRGRAVLGAGGGCTLFIYPPLARKWPWKQPRRLVLPWLTRRWGGWWPSSSVSGGEFLQGCSGSCDLFSAGWLNDFVSSFPVLLLHSFHEAEKNGAKRLHSEDSHQLLCMQAVSIRNFRQISVTNVAIYCKIYFKKCLL